MLTDSLNLIKVVSISDYRGYLNGEWQIYSVIPTPYKEDIEKVVKCIVNDYEVEILPGGRLTSTVTKFKKRIDKELQNIVEMIDDKEFTIAVKFQPGKLPIVVSLNPEINYDTYPSHPHINPGVQKGFEFDNLCIAKKLSDINGSFDKIEDNLMFQILLWLFRHQVYEIYLDLYSKVNWIGNESNEHFLDLFYPTLLNPYGRCRCGAKTSYQNCCLKDDIPPLSRFNLDRAINSYLLRKEKNSYMQQIFKENF